MNYVDLNKYIAVAEQAALSAGAYLGTHRTGVLVQSGHDKDVKTASDRETERRALDRTL